MAVRRKFAVAAAECYAADAGWMLTASMVDKGGIDFSLETAACKVFASELAFRSSVDAMQIAGGIGYSKEYLDTMRTQDFWDAQYAKVRGYNQRISSARHVDLVAV